MLKFGFAMVSHNAVSHSVQQSDHQLVRGNKTPPTLPDLGSPPGHALFSPPPRYKDLFPF